MNISLLIYLSGSNTPSQMTTRELQLAIQAKTIEIQAATEAGKPHEELVKLYKELKELHFLKVQAETNLENSNTQQA